MALVVVCFASAAVGLTIQRRTGRSRVGAHIMLGGLFVSGMTVRFCAGAVISGPEYIPALVTSFAIVLTGVRGGLAWGLLGALALFASSVVAPLAPGLFTTGPLSLGSGQGAPLGAIVILSALAGLHEHLYTRSLEHAARQRARLAVALDARTAFVANVTHELRTPVAGIVGLCDVMLHGEHDPDRRRNLEAMRNSAGALLGVVSDVLDFSSLEMNGLEIRPVTFSLQEVIDDVLLLLTPIATQSGLALRTRSTGVIPPSLLGDGQHIRQVLFNIVGNAIKFTRAGHVEICTTVHAPDAGAVHFTIAVIDTGPGISAADRARIFEPFEQADPSMRRRAGGTGLGLHISRRIVELMHGQLTVDSEPDVGTTFTVALTLAIAPADGPAAEPIGALSVPTPLTALGTVWHQSGARVATGKVLIAEDSEVNQLVLLAMMARAGVVCELVENGRDAVNRAASAEFDIVLMDLQMPGVDGIEATTAIRALPSLARAVPIIGLTATDIPETYQRCMAAGFSDVRQKPLDYPNLIAILSRYAPAALANIASSPM